MLVLHVKMYSLLHKSVKPSDWREMYVQEGGMLKQMEMLLN